MKVFSMTIQITPILKLFSTQITRVSFATMHSLNVTFKVTSPLENGITLVTVMGVCLQCHSVQIVCCF